MFKKLKNKIQVELDKEHSSTNVSMCSSMSSSRADLTQEEQNAQKNQAFDSLAALVNDIEEEEDSEEIVQVSSFGFIYQLNHSIKLTFKIKTTVLFFDRNSYIQLNKPTMVTIRWFTKKM